MLSIIVAFWLNMPAHAHRLDPQRHQCADLMRAVAARARPTEEIEHYPERLTVFITGAEIEQLWRLNVAVWRESTSRRTLKNWIHTLSSEGRLPRSERRELRAFIEHLETLGAAMRLFSTTHTFSPRWESAWPALRALAAYANAEPTGPCEGICAAVEPWLTKVGWATLDDELEQLAFTNYNGLRQYLDNHVRAVQSLVPGHADRATVRNAASAVYTNLVYVDSLHVAYPGVISNAQQLFLRALNTGLREALATSHDDLELAPLPIHLGSELRHFVRTFGG